MYFFSSAAVPKNHSEMFENLPSSSLGQHNRNMSNSNPTIHEPAKGHNKSVSMVGEAWMEDVIKYDNIAGNR